MTIKTNTTLRAVLFGTAAAATLTAGAPAFAQTAAGASAVEELVVTGSRIRRSEFTSPSPLTVVTAEQATAEGVITTSEILQSTSEAVSARQIDNEFTGLVAAGGPGVNTLSLRGLGPQRTLILLNGKRVSPAGTRGQVGAVDLNTLPATIVDRIEILKDGASSIYGSDAVAGVVNIITKDKLDGLQLNIAGVRPFMEGGEQFRVSGSWGKTFDRGFINVSAERFEQFSLTTGDRADLGCAQDYFYDQRTGARVDLTYPNGQYVCIGTASGVYTRNADTARYVSDPTAVQNGSTNPTLAIDLNGYRRVNLSYTNLVPAAVATRAGYNAALFNAACTPAMTASGADLTDPGCVQARINYVRASQAAYPQNDPRSRETTAISPVVRTSFYLTGGYDLTDNLELFTEILGGRRESEQTSYGQIFNNVQGCTGFINTPTCVQNPTNPFPFAARTTLLIPRNQDQTVDYIRAVGGARGNFDFNDRRLDWELFGIYAKSDADYGGQFTYADRVAAIVGLTGTPTNVVCNANLITVSDGGPNPLVRDGAQACVPVNVFRSDLVVPNAGRDLFTQAERDFLFGYEVGNTTYTQTILEGSISGPVMDLPAGPLGLALGFQWRRDEIDDTPGFNAINQNYAGSTTAGRTAGKDSVKEVFGELAIPLLKDFPIAQSLDLSLSGRHTEYDSYGKNSTWKIGLNWQLSPWLRIRATDGTSYRAPALYEMYLANQTGFQAQTVVDPCINTSSSTNAVLQANCDAALRAVGVAPDRLRTFSAPGGSATVLTGGGGPGILNPETSHAKTIGVILTPTFTDLRIAVDYSEIMVNDQVSQFGAVNIPLTCYRSANPANEPLCQLFTRQNNPTASNYQGIGVINNSYVNIAKQSYRAIDLTTQYNHDFDWARMRIDTTMSWALEQKRQILGQTVRDFNGEVLTPDFVATGSIRFDRGPWRATWSFDVVGKTSDTEVAPDVTVITSRGPNPATTPGVPDALVARVYYRNHIDLTQYHALSLRWRQDDLSATIGVRNLFDQRPPTYSNSANETRIGSAILSSQYDLLGRRLFFDVTKTW